MESPDDAALGIPPDVEALLHELAAGFAARRVASGQLAGPADLLGYVDAVGFLQAVGRLPAPAGRTVHEGRRCDAGLIDALLRTVAAQGPAAAVDAEP